MYTPINIILKNEKEYIEVMNTDTFKLASIPLSNYKKEVRAGRIEKWTNEAINRLYKITRLGIESKDNVYILIGRTENIKHEYILVDMYRRKLVVNTKQTNKFTRNISKITLLNGEITIENGDIYMEKLSTTDIESRDKITKELSDSEITVINKKSLMMEFGYNIEKIDGEVVMRNNSQAERIESLVVPTGVTKIDGFHSLKSIKTIQIAGTCREIGNSTTADWNISKNGNVFFFCKHLEKIEFKEGVAVIHSGVANFCKGLKEVYLPSTLTSIAEDCFNSAENCNVYIPKDNKLPDKKLHLNGTGLNIVYI